MPYIMLQSIINQYPLVELCKLYSILPQLLPSNLLIQSLENLLISCLIATNMPPILTIPMVTEPGQTKLDFTGQLKAKRPGKLSNPETRIPL
jgi:hypothetical protein